MAKSANVRFGIQTLTTVRAAYQTSPAVLAVKRHVLRKQTQPDRTYKDHDRGEAEKYLERPEDHLSLVVPLDLFVISLLCRPAVSQQDQSNSGYHEENRCDAYQQFPVIE